MGCDRRIIHANHLLAILLLVLSTMFAYADRDTFLQEKLRNRISSPLLRKWRDNSIEGAEEETNSNGEWKEELLSNLRDLLRQHHITAASPSSLRQRLGTDISAYGDDPIPQLPVDQLFVLDDGPTSSRDSSSSSSSSSSLLSPSYGGGLNGPEKRNGFFFGKRNGFFFGKRSGMSSAAASTKMDDEDRQFMQPFDGTALDETMRAGRQGTVRDGGHLL